MSHAKIMYVDPKQPSQLVACWSEHSDFKFDFRNEVSDTNNHTLDMSHAKIMYVDPKTA